jgi:SAM-dependent methyltransferase
MASFIDFYNRHSIIPVHQNNPDPAKYIAKRLYLLNSLGIPTSLLPHISICEFGPGTGQNAKVLIELGAVDLTLVDASDQAIESLCRLKHNNKDHMINLDIFKTNFLDFKSDNKFDLVVAEGCIPHQSDPEKIVKAIASHIGLSGILLISTISGLSHLSETLRRVYSSLLLDKGHPEISDLDCLVNFFEPDLCYLSSRSRSTTDWCLDVIIQPLHESSLFSQPEAITALRDDFQVYHTLPALLSPFYWYKNYDQELCSDTILDTYYQSNLCLISTNARPTLHPSSAGFAAEALGKELWDVAASFQNGRSTINDLTTLLRDLSVLYSSYYPHIADLINDSIFVLSNFSTALESEAHTRFRSFWGRGQQYLSLLRK